MTTLSDHLRPPYPQDVLALRYLPQPDPPIDPAEEAFWDEWAAIGERSLRRCKTRARHRHARAYVRHQAERALARFGRVRALYRVGRPSEARWWYKGGDCLENRCECHDCCKRRKLRPDRQFARLQVRKVMDADAADLEALCEVTEPDPMVQHAIGLDGCFVAPEHIALADRVYADGRRMQREAAERDADEYRELLMHVLYPNG